MHQKGQRQSSGRSRRSSRCLRVLLVALALLQPLTKAKAQTTEDQLKTAFLFNFAHYVSWPATAFTNSEAPLVIGIYGAGPSHGAIRDMLEGRTVDSRKIKVIRAITLKELQACHIAFLAPQKEEPVGQVIQSVDKLPVLTVGESPGFVASGGAIRLVRGEDTIRFKIDLDVLDRHGLKASSQMLRLDKAVIMRSGKEVRKP